MALQKQVGEVIWRASRGEPRASRASRLSQQARPTLICLPTTDQGPLHAVPGPIRTATSSTMNLEACHVTASPMAPIPADTTAS